jgi:hypothetical protein
MTCASHGRTSLGRSFSGPAPERRDRHMRLLPEWPPRCACRLPTIRKTDTCRQPPDHRRRSRGPRRDWVVIQSHAGLAHNAVVPSRERAPWGRNGASNEWKQTSLEEEHFRLPEAQGAVCTVRRWFDIQCSWGGK